METGSEQGKPGDMQDNSALILWRTVDLLNAQATYNSPFRAPNTLDPPMPTMRAADRLLRSDLASLYEEVMWLAARKNVTPSMARAWYTHVVAGRLSRRIRQFSGKVSYEAISDAKATLRLEHHARIQTTLTQLVESHLKRKRPNPQEFMRVVLKCENVHIVTFAENYAAMRNDGNYRRAGIKLVAWRSIPKHRREALWKTMLRGKVANAANFAPSI